ncbi:MAG: PBP1A family penicillin-binding protein [Cyanobacteria bacterium P01_E01_bin.6]
MADFLDKLKALSEHSSATGSAPSAVTPDSIPQNNNMPLDSNSQPSLPNDAVSKPLAVDVEQRSRMRRSKNRKRSSKRITRFRQAMIETANQWFHGKKPIYHRWWLWALLAVGAASGGAYVTGKQSLEQVREGLPEPSAVFTFVREGTLTIKAADGAVLQQMGPATRESIDFDDMPTQLVEAFIAAEDKNFYNHSGVDYQAIARALRANVVARDVVEGGSTITQQLARVVFLDQSPTFDRKLREAMLAQKIETELDKEEILERYLNLVYLGSGAYGVADAAWIFFSKSLNELNLSEIATIAGLAPAPSAYSPLVDLETATLRRNSTLRRMVEAEFISEGEMERVMAQPLEVNPSLPRNFYSTHPYFTSYIEEQLPNYLSSEQIERGGLIIETTLNRDWQQKAETAVQRILEEYGSWQRFSDGAMVSIDPRTGEILTMVAGDDFRDSQFNLVTQAQRQPGSTFKTFVYSAAIAAGFSPYKSYVDAQYIVDGYEPKNYGRSFRGNVSLQDALTSSINVVAVKTLIDVGFSPVIDLAHAMGIQSELFPYYSLALGSNEVNLLELTSAYGTLATQGNYIEPHGIVRILDERSNEVVYEAQFEQQRALDADTSAIITNMLERVVQSGTGRRARLGRPVAGKTGTSEESRDLWFIGYIPQVVTGVWLGNEISSDPTSGFSATAAQAWHNFMAQIVEGMPVEDFPPMPNLNNRERSIEAQPVNPAEVIASERPRNESPENSSTQNESTQTESPSSPSTPEPTRGESTSNNSTSDDENDDSTAPVFPPAATDSDEDTPAEPVVDTAPAPAPPPITEPAPTPTPAPAPPPLPSIQPVEPSPSPAPLQGEEE